MPNVVMKYEVGNKGPGTGKKNRQFSRERKKPEYFGFVFSNTGGTGAGKIYQLDNGEDHKNHQVDGNQHHQSISIFANGKLSPVLLLVIAHF
jgi:hypothetical protein